MFGFRNHAQSKANSPSKPPDYEALRERMIRSHLLTRDIVDQRVIEAMKAVPREEFLPEHLRAAAYDDCALPLERGQTISQPYTVAFMCQAAMLDGHEIVLEVGSGSGYGAAVLSRLVKSVISIERIPELAEQARETLQRIGYDNVQVLDGDGSLGSSSEAPFDAIVVTAGANKVPGCYFGQLVDGGRIVMPVGDSESGQTMFRITKKNNHIDREPLGEFRFVPLVSGEPQR